jgi:Rod binding domain-containing protein
MDTLTAPILPTGQKAALPEAAEGANDTRLREVAEEFEAVFIGEMLKHIGLDEAANAFGGEFSGGHGEDAFRTFLVREYADAISEKGAFGLADKIYNQLKARQDSAAAMTGRIIE